MVPRIGVLAVILVAALFTPTAQASGCIDVEYSTFGEGLGVIATTGRQLALGFVSDSPGDGLGFILIITPALCGGFGLGSDLGSPETLLGDLTDTIDETMLLLPLP